MQSPQLPFTRLLLVLIALAAGTRSASGDGIRLVESDSRGVTLRLDVPSLEFVSPTPEGRVRLRAPGLAGSSPPGRPELPVAAALIALPPGARPTVRVIASGDEEVRDDVRLRIARKPGFREDGAVMGLVPALEPVPPILDGPWPTSLAELGETATIRRQQVVTVRVAPFRYDEASGRLWIRRTLTVRVDFGAPAPARALASEDHHWEPVLKSTVLNYEQGRSWREEPERDRVPPEQALRLRAGAESAAAAAAFDESEPEVRVRIDTTGVHAFEYDLLSEKGYPSGVPIAQVSVHRHEFVENATPSYVTIELPIEVVDQDQDGVFGSGDRILVFVQNWAERSRASIAQRSWGNAEMVFVTRLASGGRRVPTRLGWRDFALTSLASYPATRRWERSTVYLPVFQPTSSISFSDTNTDQFLWAPTGSLLQLYAIPDSFRFEVNHIDTSRQVTFTVNWQGTRANSHYSWAHIRNGARQFTTLADSVGWLGRGALVRTVNLFGSALTEGNTNVLRSWGKNQACNDPGNVECIRINAVMNWFEATYWRRFRALDGYLACNNGGVTGDYQIQAGGFPSSDLRVYDVTDSLNPVRLALADSLIASEGATWAVRFQDSSAGGTRRYVAFDRPRSVPPEFYTAVDRRGISQLGAGDYLLVVPFEFEAAVAPLVELREAQGLNVVVAPLEAVNDEFNGGRRSSYAIKRFIRHAYRNWDARFVLLVGDGSEDPLNQLGLATPDWIPAQKIPGPVSVFDGASSVMEAIVSDGWYVWCVDCPNPASAAMLPDLFLGRLPVNSVQQTSDMVAKIVAYEQLAPDQDWRRNMLLLADDDRSTATLGVDAGTASDCIRPGEDSFLEISQIIRDLILDEAGLVRSNPEIFDLRYLLRDAPRAADTTCYRSWPEVQQLTHLSITPQLISKLSEGRLWWNFQGHANPSVLTHEDVYLNRAGIDDSRDLANAGRPFLFSAFSCHPNTFGRINESQLSVGPSLGEDMVLLPGRGAIASWGSTGYEILPNDPDEHLNVHMARALFAHPPIDVRGRLDRWDGRVVLGEALAKTFIDNWFSGPSSLEADVAVSYVLLGDPATRISVGPAQISATANGVAVENGVPVRLYSFGDTLRIEADLASNTRIQSITLERTDAFGSRIVPATDYTLAPPFPDTLAGNGGRRFHLSFRTTLEVGSFTYTIRTVDANGLPGTFDIVFSFITVLRANGVPLGPADAVSPAAELSLLVVSPGPIADENQDFALTLNGASVPFTATPAPGDTTRREWVLTWTHAPYTTGEYRLGLTVGGGGSVTIEHVFRVDASMRIERALAFPNPFDDDAGTHFSFNLVSGGPSSVQIRVYTVAGRLIFDRTEHGLLPGYHQIAWDGRDAERDKIANGVYLYRLLARSSDGSAMHEGRLVKLRKPIRKSLEGE